MGYKRTVEDVPFHPLVAEWFTQTFAAPTAAQEVGWREIAAGRDTLIAAPTGSGKTLAAFLWAIDRLVDDAAGVACSDERVRRRLRLAAEGARQRHPEEPRRAARRDPRAAPRRGTSSSRRSASRSAPATRRRTSARRWCAARRTSSSRRRSRSTSCSPPRRAAQALAERRHRDRRRDPRDRRRQARRAPRALARAVRRPRRASPAAHRSLRHAEADRGGGAPARRRGPARRRSGAPRCAIVDVGHRRDLDLSIEITDHELGAIASHELWAAIYERIAELRGEPPHDDRLREHAPARRARGAPARAASRRRTGSSRITAACRARPASRPRSGSRRARSRWSWPPPRSSSASTSGHVDLVCHLGAPRAIATLLQRVGRSGHFLGGVPKGILFPLTRDELVQCAAAVRAVAPGELDRLSIPESPLDILAQQIVATAAADEIDVDELFALVRRAWPVPRPGAPTLRRRCSRCSARASRRVAGGARAHPPPRPRARPRARPPRRAPRRDHRRRRHPRHGRLRRRRGATGNSSARSTRTSRSRAWRETSSCSATTRGASVASRPGNVRVAGRGRIARRRSPSGSARRRPDAELSAAVADLRREVAERLPTTPARATGWLVAESRPRAEARPDRRVRRRHVRRSSAPCRRSTRSSPSASSTRPAACSSCCTRRSAVASTARWGLALRKRFCVSFDFELQAAATDDGIVISLGEQHSFPLDSVFGMVRPADASRRTSCRPRSASPMFTNRWRWNATRALALRAPPGRASACRCRSSGCAPTTCSQPCSRPSSRAATTGPGSIEPPDHPLVERDDRQLPPRGDGRRGPAARARGDRVGARAHARGRDRRRRRRCRTRSSTRIPTPFSTTRRSRSAARAPSRCGGRIPTWRAASARSIPRRSTRCARRHGRTCATPTSCTTRCCRSAGCRSVPPRAGTCGSTRWSLEGGRAWRASVRSAPSSPPNACVGARRAPGRLVRARDSAAPRPAGAIGAEEARRARSCVAGSSVIGPVTAADLAERLGLAAARVDAALARLEATGRSCRDRFTPGVVGRGVVRSRAARRASTA